MPLTAKQKAAVAKMPPPRRAAATAAFNKQNEIKPAATKRKPVQSAQAVPESLKYAFDGFDKRHMPVDELTAPYTTTNFTTVMDFGSSATMDQVIVVCPRVLHDQELYMGPLTDYVAMRYDASETIAGTIPTLEVVRCPIIDKQAPTASNIHLSVRARLHNQSIRLSCLGTNTGLYPPGSVYVGTVPMIETGAASTGGAEALSIKQAWADDSIAVGYLKSVPAAKLQEKPFVLDSAVAENVSFKSWRDMCVPASTADKGSLPFSTALEPIVLYIPRAGAGTTVVNYRVEIGQQWCSRHPHNVMLRSTQKQYPATSPSLWHSAVGAVKDVGEQLVVRAGGAAMDAFMGHARNMFAPPPE